MFTAKQLVGWCERALAIGAKYWYGTCWYDAEESLLTRKQKQYPFHYTAGRMSTYRKHIRNNEKVCDCVGLIKGFFWTANGTTANKYKSNGCPDVSANGMFELCKEKWTVNAMPDEPGLVVWRNGHIGVYAGGDEVIEARGFRYGVVRTKLAERDWTHAGRLPDTMLCYANCDGYNIPANETPVLKKGDNGKHVRRLQKLLLIWNSAALPRFGADGDYGDETADWVTRFQNAMGLDSTSIADQKVWDKLTDICNAAEVLADMLPVIDKSDSGGFVVLAQRLLMAYKNDILPEYGADGDFGSETAEAVRKFREAHGMITDSVIDRQTWLMLVNGGVLD